VENLVKVTTIFLFLSILVLGFTTAPAFADNIAIQNASFENFNPLNLSCGACGTYNLGPIPDWTITGGEAGSWQPGPASLTSVPDGTKVAYSNGGTISQTLTASLLADTFYNLSVDVGHRLDGPNGYATTFIISLFAGDALLKSITGSNSVITMGTFATQSLDFTSNATVPSGNLAIVLSSVGPQSDFDNVRLTATSVPEPGSLTLLAAGLGLALFVFRRR